MKTAIILILSVTSLLADENQVDIKPAFIVPAKYHTLPGIKVGPIRSPQVLEDEGRKHGGIILADVYLVSISARPHRLEQPQADALEAQLKNDPKSVKEFFSTLPMIGPQRTFAILDNNGRVRLIVFDYISGFVVYGASWFSDGIVQVDRSFQSAIGHLVLKESIKDLAEATPFEEWSKWWEEEGKWQARAERAEARREKDEPEAEQGSGGDP